MPNGGESQANPEAYVLPATPAGALSTQDIQLLMTLMDFRPKPICVFSMTLPEDHFPSGESLSDIAEEADSSEQPDVTHAQSENFLETFDGASPTCTSGHGNTTISEMMKNPVSANVSPAQGPLVTMSHVSNGRATGDTSSEGQSCEQGSDARRPAVETCVAQEELKKDGTEPVKTPQPAVKEVTKAAPQVTDDMMITPVVEASQGLQAAQVDGTSGHHRRVKQKKKKVGFAPGVVEQAPMKSMIEPFLNDAEVRQLKERQSIRELERSKPTTPPAMTPVKSMITGLISETDLEQLRENHTRPRGPIAVPPASDPIWQREHEREQRWKEKHPNLSSFTVPLRREKHTGPGR